MSVERDAADEDHVVGDAELGARARGSSAAYFSSRPAPTITSWRSPSAALAIAQARSSPSQFLYGHSDETKSTKGLVTP